MSYEETLDKKTCLEYLWESLNVGQRTTMWDGRASVLGYRVDTRSSCAYRSTNKRLNVAFRSICCAFYIALAFTAAWAQTSTGLVRGTVLDTSGAPVSEATVRLQNTATGLLRRQATNTEGIFEFPQVLAGSYTVAVEKAGFRKETIEAITLQVAEVRDLRVQLTVGEVSESVTVTADPAAIQTTESSLSQVIDERRVSQLPLNGRNMLQLIGLAPGVNIGGRASAVQRQANYGPSFTLGGQRDNTSIVLVDGIEISGMEVNNYPLAVPSLESVSEFRVVTA